MKQARSQIESARQKLEFTRQQLENEMQQHRQQSEKQLHSTEFHDEKTREAMEHSLETLREINFGEMMVHLQEIDLEEIKADIERSILQIEMQMEELESSDTKKNQKN